MAYANQRRWADMASDEMVASYNARFAKPRASAKDLHRPMAWRDRLEDAFSWQVERTLSQSPRLQCD